MEVWLKSFFDKIVPILVALAAGEKGRELAVLAQQLLARAKRVGLIAEVIWRSWILFVTVKIRKAFLVWSLLPTLLTAIIIASAQRWCGGPFAVPTWIYLWPFAAGFVIVRGMAQVASDAPRATVPADLFDGRLGDAAPVSAYSEDELAREFNHAGHRPEREIIDDLTRASTARQSGQAMLDPNELARLTAERDRFQAELDARRAFERELYRRPAMQPLMSAEQLAEALAPYQPLDRSPLRHLKGMAYELLLVALLLLGADLSLGTYAFQNDGVNLLFPILVGLCGYATLLLWSAAYWVGVVLPAEGFNAVTATSARPITALYHLIARILPEVEGKNVESMFGRFNGSLVASIRTQLETFGKLSRVKIAALYTIGLVLPHFFVAFAVIVTAAVIGSARENKQIEGLDTKKEQQDDAVRLQKVLSWGLAIVLSTIFVLTFAREAFIGLLMWTVTQIDAILHPLSRLRMQVDWGGGFAARNLIALAVGLALLYYGLDWSKGKGTYQPKLGAALAVFGAILVANLFIRIPYLVETSTIQGVRSALACPLSEYARPNTRVPEPEVVVAPTAPSATVSTPVVTTSPESATPSSAPSRPRSSRHRSRRREQTGIYVAAAGQSLGCDARRLAPCGNHRDPEDVLVLRAACLCR